MNYLKEYVEKNFVELKSIENLIQLPNNLKIGELSLAFSMKKYTDDEAEKIMKFLNTASVTEKLNCNFYE